MINYEKISANLLFITFLLHSYLILVCNDNQFVQW